MQAPAQTRKIVLINAIDNVFGESNALINGTKIAEGWPGTGPLKDLLGLSVQMQDNDKIAKIAVVPEQDSSLKSTPETLKGIIQSMEQDVDPKGEQVYVLVAYALESIEKVKPIFSWEIPNVFGIQFGLGDSDQAGTIKNNVLYLAAVATGDGIQAQATQIKIFIIDKAFRKNILSIPLKVWLPVTIVALVVAVVIMALKLRKKKKSM